MATIITTVGLNDKAYEAIKQSAQNELKNVPFTIRRHKQGYAYNAIDIRPTKKCGNRWTPEQVMEVVAFLDRHNLFNGMFHSIRRSSPENVGLVYGHGFNYLSVVVG